MSINGKRLDDRNHPLSTEEETLRSSGKSPKVIDNRNPFLLHAAELEQGDTKNTVCSESYIHLSEAKKIHSSIRNYDAIVRVDVESEDMHDLKIA